MRNDMEQQIEIQNRIQSMMEISSLESVVKFYARFDFSQDSKKTPKYTMSLQAGDCKVGTADAQRITPQK